MKIDELDRKTFMYKSRLGHYYGDHIKALWSYIQGILLAANSVMKFFLEKNEKLKLTFPLKTFFPH